MEDILVGLIADLTSHLTSSQATKEDLTHLTHQNEVRFSEVISRLDTIEENLGKSVPSHLPSYADVAKRPKPATLVIKPADQNTSIKQLRDSLTSLPCPSDIVVKNFKTKMSHLRFEQVARPQKKT